MCVGLSTGLSRNSESREQLIMKIYNKRLVFDEKVEKPENLLDAVENYLEAFGIIATIKAGVALDSVRRPIFRVKEIILGGR